MVEKKYKEWFDRDLAELLADKIIAIDKDFDRQGFIEDIDCGIRELEYKARLRFFADRLKYYLPDDYPEAIETLISILGAENTEETGMFTNFYWTLPVASYIEFYGLDYFDESMNAIAEITKRSTGEFAIRPFLQTKPIPTIKVMEKWSSANNFHLRRLSSEGARPRLPWATKLAGFIEDPTPVLPILENLKDDPIRFVQKSVANHLNDIFKDNYDLGMNIIARWREKPSPQRKWIIKHALRKQAKDGNPIAIKIRSSL